MKIVNYNKTIITNNENKIISTLLKLFLFFILHKLEFPSDKNVQRIEDDQ